MFLPVFARMSALTQAARQGLSARNRFARANMILNLAFCFSRPRYRVFRKRSCFFTTPNACSTFARTDDFACAASLTVACSSSLSFFIWEGRMLILYWIFRPDLFSTTAASRFSVPRKPPSPSWTFAAVASAVCTNPLSVEKPFWKNGKTFKAICTTQNLRFRQFAELYVHIFRKSRHQSSNCDKV